MKMHCCGLPHLVFVFTLGPVMLVDSFKCGVDTGKLQVHLVPHSHDDVGWQKTVDQYFYGTNISIQAGAVKLILDSVVDSLLSDSSYTFIVVEMAFFSCWWKQQNESMQVKVKQLVAERRIEFVNGGWCMNDEATTHYNDIIDQMTYGLDFIRTRFGEDARPTVAWQIDPFGHSSEQAALFSRMSFDGLFLGRIDFADKEKRLREQRMEMIWQGSRSFGWESRIFAGVLFNMYDPPKGFCYDKFCADPPIQDDPHYPLNVKERVDAFVSAVCKQAGHYRANHVMLTMGSDFQYEIASLWYKSLDKLIRYVNEDGRVNVFYSTPSRYLQALHQANLTWELKTDDFFPYSHCPHCYWTGYFTSRPALKGYIRKSNNLLQACNQLEALRAPTSDNVSSDALRAAMAIAQHHDAVTGTEKQHVAYDYAKRLAAGSQECQVLISGAIGQKYLQSETRSSSNGSYADPHFQFCDLLNVSICRHTETESSVAINIYNPLARVAVTYLRIPFNYQNVLVTDFNGRRVVAQVLPISAETGRLRRSHPGFAAFEVVFEVHAPALGFTTFFLRSVEVTSTGPVSEAGGSAHVSSPVALDGTNSFIEGDDIRLDFSLETGRVVSMRSKSDGSYVSLDQQFLYYKGSVGDDDSIQTSGAYVFRPVNGSTHPVCPENRAKIEVYKGPVIEELRQSFGSFVSQVIRVYRSARYAEFEHTVGPIPIADGDGKEIVTRFQTNIDSKFAFYTDANGREMQERRVNYRSTWKLNVTEPVAGNYYPIVSTIFIKDDRSQFTVMTDRAQGGSSLESGQMELMVHRRLLRDDFLGVAEALNEPGEDKQGLITRGVHRLLLSRPDQAASLYRVEGQQMLLSPVVSFAKNTLANSEWREKFRPFYSALNRQLPANVHLLSLQRMSSGQLLLRLEHIYEAGEDVRNSLTATIDLRDLFAEFTISHVEEMNLSANQELSKKSTWAWNTGEPRGGSDREVKSPRSVVDPNASPMFTVELVPMEIRTFLLNVAYKKN